MELIKPPFYPEGFSHHRHYMEEVKKFHTKHYAGKSVVFNCDLVGISGSVRHAKGDKAKIVECDCGMFKLENSKGPIDGLFKPTCLDLVE
jgi:hypothetical protein